MVGLATQIQKDVVAVADALVMLIVVDHGLEKRVVMLCIETKE